MSEKITEANLELAREYLGNMKLLINHGQYPQFGNVQRDFDNLLSSMERGNYFSREQVDELKEERNSIADPRVLQHLAENF